MVTVAQVRELALGLPDAAEQDHHGIPSFRVRGKIFATLPDADHLRVMAAQGEILAAVAEAPAACSEFWWGSRLACVVVDLQQVEPVLLGELVLDAWRRKAPRRLVTDLDAAGPAARRR
ncbi:MAG: MmcQ/YjbR family DNA-binding protein [Solirubrobacteraceae bacterium]